MRSLSNTNIYLRLLLLSSLLILLLLGLSHVAGAGAAVLYVSAENDCGLATPCYVSIQAAVAAAEQGDTVKVAAGTYTSTGSRLLLIDKPGISLIGGYTPNDWNTSNHFINHTVLDGQGTLDSIILINLADDFATDPMREPIVIQSFTIKNAGSDGEGAIEIEEGDVDILSTTIQNNATDGIHSDGVFATQPNNVTVKSSFIEANGGIGISLIWDTHADIQSNYVSHNQRGGIQVGVNGTGQIDNNNVVNNQYYGIFGGCLQSISVTNNNIDLNVGGISFGGGGYFLITDNAIQANKPPQDVANASAVSIYGVSTCSELVTEVQFDRNIVYDVHEETLPTESVINQRAPDQPDSVRTYGENNMIYSTRVEGAAVYIEDGALDAFNWTIIRTEGIGTGILSEGSSTYVGNTILTGFETALSGAVIEAENPLLFNNRFNCADGAQCSGVVEGNPNFVNDWRISADSAAFNTATDIGTTTDIDGDARPSCGDFDIGADEVIQGQPITPLWLEETSVANGRLEALVRWTVVPPSQSLKVLYSNEPITDDNVDMAQIAATPWPGSDNQPVDVPYEDGQTIYFAVIPANSCTTLPILSNALYPSINVFLPAIHNQSQ